MNAKQEHERLALWMRLHARAVWGYAFAMVRDRDVADDLVQEAFCRAWEARCKYEDAGKDRAYLLRIADRLALDHLRRRGRETQVSDEAWNLLEPVDDAASPIDSLARSEAAGQLKEALQALSASQRRALLLRYFGNLDFREIAETMRCPLGTALSHVRRGLQSLRRLLCEEAS